MDCNRRLTPRERQVLEHLLSLDDPRFDPLRAQARAAVVVGECCCGCATVDLHVDPQLAPAALGPFRTPAIEARTYMPAMEDVQHGYELLLFVRDGWLESLEIVYYGNTVPTQFPPVSKWDAPFTVEL